MGATNATALVGLPQFTDNDKPSWRGDINGAMADIDAKFSSVDGLIAQTLADIAALPSTIDARIDGRAPVSLEKKYNVKTTNTGAQNYNGCVAAIAAGETNLILPSGDVPMTIPNEGLFMFSFLNQKGIRLRGGALSTRLIDTTAYGNNTALTGLVKLDACTGFEMSGINYVGPVLGSPQTLLGYQGASIVYAINGTKNVRIDADIANARYGLVTGSYSTPTMSFCSGFKVNITGSMIGYPIAAYTADDIEHNVDVNGVHRATYIAGCDNVRGVVRYKDQYIAPVAYLISDSLIEGNDAAAQLDPVASATKSRGSSNVKVLVIDKGSTVFQSTSQVAGISLSRVDPMRYENIDVTVYTKATNTVSTKVGGFSCTSSGVGAIWSRYTKGWDQNVILDGITVRGIVDHSAVTNGDTGNTTGELYINTWDDVAGPTYYAKAGRFDIDGFTYYKSPASTRPVFIGVREPAVPVRVSQLNAPGATVVVLTSTTIPTTFDNCTFDTLNIFGAIASLIQLGASNTINKQLGPSAIRVGNQSRGVGNAGGILMHKEITITPVGANYSWTNAIPAGSILMGVQSRVTTAITGASGYQIGVAGDLTRYADKTGTAVDTVTSVPDYAATETGARVYTANTHLVITGKTAAFTAGAIRIVISYLSFANLT